MYTGLLHLHSVLRWLILIFLLYNIYIHRVDIMKPFTVKHRKAGLLLMICCDLMLLIGLYQWIAGPLGLKAIKANGFSTIMKNAHARFFAVEHIFAMIIAIVLVHIGYAYSKKNLPDPAKHKRMLILFSLALLVILIAVPWPFRSVGAGRTWLPGM